MSLRLLLLTALATVLCALAGFPASAQPVGRQPLGTPSVEVRWDSLGPGEGRRATRNDLDAVVVQPSPDGDPFADTLFGAEFGDLFRLAPGDLFFGPQVNEVSNPTLSEVYVITATGTHVSNDRGVTYSTDGGRTWARAEMTRAGVVDGSVVNGFFESGALGLLGAGQGGVLWQSRDDGRTWDVLHDFEIGFSNSYAVRELAGDTRPGAEPSPWAGRLVMGFRGPIRYSDDQGQTWREVALPVTDDWHEIEEAPDGTLYLGGVFGTFVYASSDGGASWREVAYFRPGAPIDVLDAVPENLRIAVAPDGALWVGVTALNGTRAREGTFVVSRDGGRSWTEAAAGYGGYGVNDLAFDSAGRLVAATQVGVWRTAAPVVVSAEQTPPVKRSDVGLLRGVWPNPAGSAVQIAVRVAKPQEVRVRVVDVLGREVALVHDGQLGSARTFALETAGWPAGVYVVEVQGRDGTDTHRFTIAQ